MKRRDILAGTGVTLAASLAGCLGDDDDIGDTPEITAVELTVEAVDIEGAAGITRQFTAEQPGGLWTRLTNTGSSSIEIGFDGFPSPFFYELVHDDEEETPLVITDEIYSQNPLPEDPVDDCWRSGYPPRPPSTTTRRIGVDDSLTSLYYLTAPSGADHCVNEGSYTSTYELDIEELLSPVPIELSVTFED